MASADARRVFEEELGGARLVEWVDKPLGSASVAQVHAARLSPSPGPLRHLRRGRAVAIKVRRPGTSHFARDLRAVRTAAGLVQRFELNFDLLSAIDELRDRIALEIDFRNEFDNMRDAGSALRRATRGAVAAPEAIAATERCLITQLVDGQVCEREGVRVQKKTCVRDAARRARRALATPPQALSAIARDKEATGGGGAGVAGGAPSALERAFGGRLFGDLYDAYGRMLLLSPTFHADPHPGNLMVPRRAGRAHALSTLRAIVPPGLRAFVPYAPPRLAAGPRRRTGECARACAAPPRTAQQAGGQAGGQAGVQAGVQACAVRLARALLPPGVSTPAHHCTTDRRWHHAHMMAFTFAHVMAPTRRGTPHA
eukprot:1666927-Prymnesium_polylepis.2